MKIRGWNNQIKNAIILFKPKSLNGEGDMDKKIPFLDLKTSLKDIRDEIDEAIKRVVDNTSFVLGKELEDFESEFASYCGTKYAVGTSSGTSALHLILLGYGIGEGDEVITVPNTFIATVEAIAMTGATPVLVDVDPDTALIDVEKVREAISPKTRAVIAVHLFGQCSDMDPLVELAAERGIKVIEDACQAHGATYKDRRAGSLGDAAAFSFYPSKNLGAFGEGGAVTTNDKELYDRIKALRHHAQYEKNIHKEIGYNYRLDTLQAAILRVKLKHLDRWNDMRRSAAEAYRKGLEGTSYWMPKERPECRHIYHLFTIGAERKTEVEKKLSDAGISWGEHYPVPVHLQPAFSYLGKKKGDYPIAERLMESIISLPMFPEIDHEDISFICKVLRKADSSVSG